MHVLQDMPKPSGIVGAGYLIRQANLRPNDS